MSYAKLAQRERNMSYVVRIIGWDCNVCAGALARVCRRSTRNPAIATIPDSWNWKCPHGHRGIEMEMLTEYSPKVDEWQANPDEEVAAEPCDVGDVEAPD